MVESEHQELEQVRGPVPGLGFAVQDSVTGGRHTLILKGELDVTPADELEALLLRLCGDRTTAIGLDLRQLTFMGSSGIRVILKARELCERYGYEFFVIPGPRNVQRLFELTGVRDLLPMDAQGAPGA